MKFTNVPEIETLFLKWEKSWNHSSISDCTTAAEENSCGALRDLVPFVQFKKREKHPSRSVNFSKVAGCITNNKTVILMEISRKFEPCFLNWKVKKFLYFRVVG